MYTFSARRVRTTEDSDSDSDSDSGSDSLSDSEVRDARKRGRLETGRGRNVALEEKKFLRAYLLSRR